MKTITLSHGNGGEENNELISKVFTKRLKMRFWKKVKMLRL